MSPEEFDNIMKLLEEGHKKAMSSKEAGKQMIIDAKINTMRKTKTKLPLGDMQKEVDEILNTLTPQDIDKFKINDMKQPEEEAIELIEKFNGNKEHALIAVNMLIDSYIDIEYWKEVKEAINKL